MDNHNGRDAQRGDESVVDMYGVGLPLKSDGGAKALLKQLEGINSTSLCETPIGTVMCDYIGHEQATEHVYIPDNEDLQSLASQYLKDHIDSQREAMDANDDCAAINSEHYYSRFERIAEVLGGVTRRRIIDRVDEEMLREHGDTWHAFKAMCKDGFFSS